jgi:hypothetical protein
VFALDQLNRIGGCVRTLPSNHQGTIVTSDANVAEWNNGTDTHCEKLASFWHEIESYKPTNEEFH